MLEVDGICFSYGDTRVLQGLDLEVKEGEMVALVGPNGSGKSTLLKVISGALKPRSGSVRWSNRDLVSISSRERAKIVAVVSQTPYIPGSLTALEMAVMGRTPYLGLLRTEGRGDVEIVRRAMELTGTWEFANQPMDKLSGGERQRVLIARALSQEAPLLLLDEPSLGLAPLIIEDLFDRFITLNKETGLTMLIVEQNANLALDMADYAYVIESGEIALHGTSDQLKNDPAVQEAYLGA